jgi:hypothetical protein
MTARQPQMKPGIAASPSPSSDLLSQMIERLRPLLHRGAPVKQRITIFWSFVIESRHLGASDVVAEEFRALACDTGLISDLGRHGAEDVEHVISWGLRNFNPFESGSLQ